MVQTKILVTGANGQLGSEIKELAASYSQFQFIFTDYQELSIIDEQAVQLFFDRTNPDYCINCAAYTAVDKAEDPAEYQLVKELNASAVSYLAKACEKQGTKFIHISTDYVFDGNATTPYKPEDVTEPVSVYGTTKLAGEKSALENTQAIVIRTAWVYSSFGKNFVKTMINLMAAKPAINVVSDQLGTPTYAADLAFAIMQIIASGKWQPGIYHYTNEGITNWYEFALAIKENIHASCTVSPIPTSGYPTPAKRPAYSVLDKSKIVEIYTIQIPYWKDSLKACIEKLTA